MADSIISQFVRTYNLPIEVNKVVADTSARDAIPSSVRYAGMVVYVQAADQDYQLQGGTTNGDWVVYGTTGVSGSFTTTDGKTVTVTRGLITNIV